MIEAGQTNTVVRVLTPLFAGAISVVRLAGPRAPAILESVFTPARPRRLDTLVARDLCFGRLIEDGEPLDDAVVTVAEAGSAAATVDINVHGGVRLVQRIVMLCERLGAVPADAASGIDRVWPAANAVEREIDALLPKARTQRVATWLARLREVLPAALLGITDRLTAGAAAEVAAEIEAMASRYPAARRLIDGVTVALVGPVNAGKSTLANRLAGREQSIATDVPGTTRDWVSGSTALGGVPAMLIDTAGVRTPGDDLERQAMRHGLARAASADVVLWVIDGSREGATPGPETPGGFRGRLIAVMNKADRGLVVRPDELPAACRQRVVTVSAVDGRGLRTLIGEIINVLELGGWADDLPSLLTARQYILAGKVLTAISGGANAAAGRALADLIGAWRAGECPPAGNRQIRRNRTQTPE